MDCLTPEEIEMLTYLQARTRNDFVAAKAKMEWRLNQLFRPQNTVLPLPISEKK